MRFLAILAVLVALAVPAYAGDTLPVAVAAADAGVQAGDTGNDSDKDNDKEKEKEKAKKAEHLEEVVVTATRTERATEEVPAAVTVVTKEDIKDNRMFGVSEALTGIAGVQSETKNGGYDSRLIIRGAGLKARYGVREIMILLDGVPITDPDGMSRLDFVDTQQVESIDVVKGPNSTMYGANAAGGVINIITKNPFEETKSAKLAYGSENTQMYNLNYGNRLGDTYFSISGSRRSTDSWRAWNKFSTNQGNLKLGQLFDDGSTLEAAVSYTKANFQLPGTLTRLQFDTDISQATSEPWRNSVRNSEILYANVRLDKEIGKIRLRPTVYAESWNHFHPVTGFINDGGANVYGADVQADVSHTLYGMDSTFTVGVAGQLDDADGEKYTYRDIVPPPPGETKPHTTSYEKGVLAEIDQDTTTKWGVFVQESVRPSDRWIIDAGVRYDQVRFDIHDRIFQTVNYNTIAYTPTSATVSLNKTYDSISPRLGVVCRLADFLHMYGNVSTGFQTPQSSELSKNTDLKPMHVINYEAGLKARSDAGHSADLSVFYMRLNDEIVENIEAGQSTYSNAGKTDKFGVELSGKARLMDGLFVGGAYTYSDFKYNTFQEPVRVGAVTVLRTRDGNQLPYIPVHQYSAYINYRHPSGFKCRVDAYTWGSYYLDNANTEKHRGYEFLTNALVGYEKGGLDLTFSVNNVFDKHYAMEVTKDTANKVSYRPGAPLTWMLMATYNFPGR